MPAGIHATLVSGDWGCGEDLAWHQRYGFTSGVSPTPARPDGSGLDADGNPVTNDPGIFLNGSESKVLQLTSEALSHIKLVDGDTLNDYAAYSGIVNGKGQWTVAGGVVYIEFDGTSKWTVYGNSGVDILYEVVAANTDVPTFSGYTPIMGGGTLTITYAQVIAVDGYLIARSEAEFLTHYNNTNGAGGVFLRQRNGLFTELALYDYEKYNKLTPAEASILDAYFGGSTAFVKSGGDYVVDGEGYVVSDPTAMGRELWIPSEEPTMISWYDATDSSTITEVDNKVSQWDDKVGSNHLTTSAPNEPNTGSVINNMPALIFDPNDRLRNLTFPTPVSRDLTTIIVGKVNNVDNNQDSMISMQGTTRGWSLRSASVNEFRSRLFAQSMGSNVDALNPPRPGPAIYEAVFDWQNTKHELFIDGEKQGEATTLGGIQTPSALRIAVDATETNYLECDIGELVICESVTEEIRHKLEGYLAHKWGLTLSHTNPYRISPPLK